MRSGLELGAPRRDLEGEPKPSTSPGWGWSTDDPDGHGLFFNTHVKETTPEYREAQVSERLRSTEWGLLDLGASEECLRVFREHVLPRSAAIQPAAEPGMFVGGPALCFRVKNLDQSIRFYESLGLKRVDGGVRPKIAIVLAQLCLKLADEDKAFPHIEALAPTHPDQAKELVKEFLRVWTRNHDPNADRNMYRNQWIFFFGPLEFENHGRMVRRKHTNRPYSASS